MNKKPCVCVCLRATRGTQALLLGTKTIWALGICGHLDNWVLGKYENMDNWALGTCP